MWNPLGEILWQHPVSSTKLERIDTLLLHTEDTGITLPDVAVLSPHSLQVRGGREGKLLWSKESKPQETHIQMWTSGADDKELCVLYGDGDAYVRCYDSANGAVLHDALPTTMASSAQVASLPSHLVLLEGDSVGVFSKGTRISKITELRSLIADEPSSPRVLGNSRSHFILQSGFSVYLIQVGVGGELKLRQKFQMQGQGAAWLGDSEDGGEHLAIALPLSRSLKIVRVSDSLSATDFALGGSVDCVERLFLRVTRESTSALLSTCDLRIVLLEVAGGSAAPVWEREEALAYVSKVQFLHLPTKHALSSLKTAGGDVHKSAAMYSDFAAVVASQIRSLEEWFESWRSGTVSGTNSSEEYAADSFGFRQFVLVATQRGRLFALDSVGGSVVWRRNLFASQCEQVSQLYVVRTVAHYPPLAALITECQEESYVDVHLINPLSGEDAQPPVRLGIRLKQALALPLQGSLGNTLVLLQDSNDALHVMPQTQEALSVFRENARSIYIHDSNLPSLYIRGYGVAEPVPSSFVAVQLWNVEFSGATQLVTSRPSPYQSVHSPTKILGDKSVLEKYLNKNMLAVAAIYPQSGAVSERLQVTLLDTITGNIIHSAFHQQAAGPIGIAQSENNIYYHYWNTQHLRVEISVLELYQRDPDWSSTTFSSFLDSQCCLPFVLQQTFVFPSRINAIGITETLQGITNKEILVGLFHGQLVGIHRSLLDARRPPKATITATDREEGLLPYDPLIAINMKSVLNYYKKVESISHIVTAPSLLESTSLVLAYGLDVFFTRTAPSNTFDLLNSDFNYQALIMTCVTLIVVTLFSTWTSRKMDLGRMWK